MPTGADGPLVVDASVVVALLADSGDHGDWAARQVIGHRLIAPHHLPVEVANALRRLERDQRLSSGGAARAHANMLSLPVHLVPYTPVAARAWELRHVLTAYDAAYVALAERLDAPLLTLDSGIAGASGVHCDVRMPVP